MTSAKGLPEFHFFKKIPFGEELKTMLDISI